VEHGHSNAPKRKRPAQEDAVASGAASAAAAKKDGAGQGGRERIMM